MELSTNLDLTSTTTQGGIFLISGVSHDTYWGIPAMIVDKNGTIFHLRLLYQRETAFDLIKKQLPFSITIWFVSLLSVAVIGRLTEIRHEANRKDPEKPEGFYCLCFP